MTMSLEPVLLPPTGGTSCPPVSLVMGIPWVVDGPLAHPPTIRTTIPSAPRRCHFPIGRSAGIVVPPLRLDGPADGNDRTGHRFRAREPSIDARLASTPPRTRRLTRGRAGSGPSGPTSPHIDRLAGEIVRGVPDQKAHHLRHLFRAAEAADGKLGGEPSARDAVMGELGQHLCLVVDDHRVPGAGQRSGD